MTNHPRRSFSARLFLTSASSFPRVPWACFELLEEGDTLGVSTTGLVGIGERIVWLPMLVLGAWHNNPGPNPVANWAPLVEERSRPAPQRNGRRKSKSMTLWIGIAVAVAVVMFVLVQRSKTRAEADAQRACYESCATKKTIRRRHSAAPVVCRDLRWSDQPVTIHSRSVVAAELATCNDATGRRSLRSFTICPGDTAEAFIKECFADVTHRFVHGRLAFLFDYAIP